MGTVLSQSINTLATGYSAPDLESIKGKGGEYYEHHTRIIGTELEGILAPQPVRVVNQYRENLSSMRRMLTAQSALQTGNGTPNTRQLDTAYKGMWV